MDTATVVNPKYVDHFGPFTIVSMYYMQYMAYSQLFQALTERNLPRTSLGCQFNQRTLTYKAQFRLCHISMSSEERSETKKLVALEKTKILKFIKDNFDSPLPEERDTIELSFDRGEILYIIGFDSKGENHHIIAVIMYVTCAEGRYINWFAVSQRTYNHTRFGKFANEQPFRNMGLGSFLLQMVQLQAVVQGYSCNLYLQSNMSTAAAKYYQHCGFVVPKANDPKLLPATLFTWYKQAKDKDASSPFVYFVTTEELENDAKQSNQDPKAPEV